MCTIEASFKLKLGTLRVDRNVRVPIIMALKLDFEVWSVKRDTRTTLILLNIDQMLLLFGLLKVSLGLGRVHLAPDGASERRRERRTVALQFEVLL